MFDKSNKLYNEAKEDVGVLFLYICDFDEIMKVEKEKVILLLENLFRIYDSLCELYGIQKIEVINILL